jgi:hypothetical protein
MGAFRRRHRHLLIRGRGALGCAAATALVLTLVGCEQADRTTAAPSASSKTSGSASPVPPAARAVTVPAAPPTSASGTPTAVLSPIPPPAPEFTWSVTRVTAEDLRYSWRKGCPVGPESLRAVTVGYHSMEGDVRTGVLVVHEDLVQPARRAFEQLFALGFPITSIRPIDEFRGDDDASMAADNTSAFNCRPAVSNGPRSWSKHAYGRAIDVNPRINPYILDGKVLPPNGAAYADRGRKEPGILTRGSPALKAFTDNGFSWGGVWSNPDYQHLQP